MHPMHSVPLYDGRRVSDFRPVLLFLSVRLRSVRLTDCSPVPFSTTSEATSGLARNTSLPCTCAAIPALSQLANARFVRFGCILLGCLTILFIPIPYALYK